jgi:hypothetical protein
MKKLVILSAFLGAMMFIANNASAVMGTITVSGTAESQSSITNKNGTFDAIQKHAVSQKDLLFILAQATGDQTITNKTTKIYFDPDAYNALLSDQIAVSQGVTNNYYGIFYYSNSVAGLVRLDGTNNLGYYSYMEFDYKNTLIYGILEGFWNPGGMEANSVDAQSSSGYTQNGNAILYIHSDRTLYNLLGRWNGSPDGYPSAFYYANDAYNGFQQDYAVIFHGVLAFKLSFSESKNVGMESESFTLKGSGDINYDQNDGTISGTVTFSGKGTNDLF